jgi:pyridoxine 4-dehydrogenase
VPDAVAQLLGARWYAERLAKLAADLGRDLDSVRAEAASYVREMAASRDEHQHDAIRTNPVVTDIAAGYGATPAQVSLAWLVAIADNVLLIPGTSSRSHLAENLAAGSLSLQDDEVTRLTTAFGTP